MLVDAWTRWRRLVDDIVGSAVGAGPVALLNFPGHRNAGDVALWLEARRTLDRLGIEDRYRAAWNGFSPDALRRRVGTRPVVLNGGGNFGDLYEGQQRLRERVIDQFRDNPIVQLPQSIHFRDPRNLERMAELIERHGRVTILCRDEPSFNLARDSFAADVRRCPDLVLAGSPVARPAAPQVDILWQERADPEARHVAVTAPDVEVADWLGLLPGEDNSASAPALAYRAHEGLMSLFQRSDVAADRLWRLAAGTFDPIAEAWVDRGRRLLSRGRVVVTDRLHGHILAAQMGIPTVVLDNSYGKVHGVLDSYTGALENVHPARDSSEALAIARRLVSGMST